MTASIRLLASHCQTLQITLVSVCASFYRISSSFANMMTARAFGVSIRRRMILSNSPGLGSRRTFRDWAIQTPPEGKRETERESDWIVKKASGCFSLLRRSLCRSYIQSMTWPRDGSVYMLDNDQSEPDIFHDLYDKRPQHIFSKWSQLIGQCPCSLNPGIW